MMAIKSSRFPTREERQQAGRAARSKVSRVAQVEWNPAARKHDLVEVILASERGRVPKLLPIKHERMCVTPFSFYRGAVPLMAADLSLYPNTGLITQLCGDAHIHNLGSYAAPDGRIIFDLNDFDETIQGPFEWDVKRMAASLVLGGRTAGDSDSQCKDAVFQFVGRYRQWMGKFSKMPVLDLARFQVSRFVKGSPVAAVLQKAARITNLQSFPKLTVLRKGRRYLREQPPLQVPAPPGHGAKVQQAIHDYSLTLTPERRHFFTQYHVEHVAFRVVGCGSVGMRDYVALMFGGGAEDPLFLQVKECTRSAYASYLPEARVPENQGERVADGQRAMQMQSDIFLGWTMMEGRDYLVRQLRDHKASIEDTDLKGAGLVEYAQVCGELLAKGHARAGDPCAMFGYMGGGTKFDRAIAKFAIAYADQTEKDFEVFKRAMRTKPAEQQKAPAKKGGKRG